MNKCLMRGLSQTLCFAVAIQAATNLLACGNNSTTIINLPPQDSGGYQIFALSPNGQLTGFFFNSSHNSHAFIYNSGGVTDLGTLGGKTSIGYAMNSAGQVAGHADLSSGSHAFLYSGGALTDLKTLGGSYSSAAAINESGQVVGESSTASLAGPFAFLYANGSMVSLGTLGSNYSTAYAINNNGMVVGQSGISSSDLHGFVYSGGVLTDVGTLGGTYSSAFALNDAGLIVGESSVASGDTHAFVYMGGHMTDLGTFGGTYSSAFAVNTNGQVAGVANTANDVATHGFLYDHGTMADLGTLGGTDASVWALNNLGQIVGQSSLPDGTGHAFLWENGAMVDLNTLLPANSGWELMSAQFINDSKRIVGFGTYAGSQQWFVMDFSTGDNPPVAIAGPDQTVDCQAQVTLDGSASSDPDNDPLTFEWSLGGTVLGTNAVLTTSLPVGTNVITLLVSDPCNASGQANVVVTVVDTTPPTGSCPTDMTASSDANCQAPVPDVVSQVVASDNCTPTASLKITQDPAAGTMVGLGPHAIAIKVTDGSGNSSSCGLTFTVQDKTPPVISSVPAFVSVSAGDNCQAGVPNVLGGVIVSDNCTPADQLILSQNPAAGTMIGTGQSMIVVTVTDASGNSSTANVTLKVADTTAPSILTVPGPLTVSAGADCQGAVPNVLPNVVATDNCTPANQLIKSQTPAAGTLLGTGQYTIVVTVSDAGGNTSTANVMLKVVDTTAPSILGVSGPLTVSTDVNCQGAVPNVLPSVVASDNCTPANQLSVSQNPAAGTLLGAGQYSIVVTVTDASGNSSNANVALTVADITPPSILSVPDPLTISADTNCQGTVPNVLANVVAIDNCTPANQLIVSQTPAAGTVLPSGQYTIVVTVTDAANNSSSANVSLTITNNNPPVVRCVTATPNVLNPPNHQLVPVSISVFASGNCNGALVSKIASVTSSEPVNVGDIQITGDLTLNLAASRNPSGPGRVYTITVQSTDGAGNTSSATVTVTVPKGNGSGTGTITVNVKHKI